MAGFPDLVHRITITMFLWFFLLDNFVVLHTCCHLSGPYSHQVMKDFLNQHFRTSVFLTQAPVISGLYLPSQMLPSFCYQRNLKTNLIFFCPSTSLPVKMSE